MLMTDCWFIHGNHDTDDDMNHDYLFNSQMKHKNLHGRVELIDGHRVAGLGGIFVARFGILKTGKSLLPFINRMLIIQRIWSGKPLTTE